MEEDDSIIIGDVDMTSFTLRLVFTLYLGTILAGKKFKPFY